MVNADDDRLLALIAAARQRFGEPVLADPARLVPFLADQAPDLRPRIRAVAAALAAQASPRLRADPMAADRLAARIAAETGMDPAQARDGVDLAMRTGGDTAGPAPPPADWVGLSTPVGSTPAAAPAQTGLPALLRNRWVLAGAAALAVLYVVQVSQTPKTPASPAPAPPPGEAATLPMLTTSPTGNAPLIPVHSAQSGTQLDFGVPIANGALHGIVLISAQGWQSALVGFAKSGAQQPGAQQPGAQQPDTLSSPGAFVLNTGQNGTARVMRPSWTRDAANAGAICVVFWQAGGPDVQLHGSRMCLLEFANSDCSRIIGCGTVG